MRLMAGDKIAHEGHSEDDAPTIGDRLHAAEERKLLIAEIRARARTGAFLGCGFPGLHRLRSGC